MVTIYVMCGVPGSGKSYYGKNLARLKNAEYISSDNIREFLFGDENIQANPARVFNTMNHNLELNIEHGLNVVYDSTMSKIKDRRVFIEKYGNKANLILVYMQTPLDECIRRNGLRTRVVDEKIIKKHFNRLQINEPSLEEGWKEIIYVKSE